MNTYKTSSELKGIAKTHLFGNYGQTVLAYILQEMILTSLSMVVASVLPASAIGNLFRVIIYVLMILIMGIFTSGSCYLYLNVACKRPISATMIFYGFKNNADKAMLIQLYILIMEFIVSIPFVITMGMYEMSEAPAMILLVGLTAAISLIGLVVIGLGTIPAFYLLHDFPQYSAKQIIKTSFNIMRENNNMGRALYLSVSFIPISLLSLISCGVASLWADPYKNTTFAEFFLDIMKSGQNNNLEV